MKILINTDEKTLKLEGSVKFEELQKFIEDNNLKDYSILPDTITVTEKEYYPYYPHIYREIPNPYSPPYEITCRDNIWMGPLHEEANVPSVFYTEIY